jgi:hypothetical protein
VAVSIPGIRLGTMKKYKRVQKRAEQRGKKFGLLSSISEWCGI